MHLLLAAAGCGPLLIEELRQAQPSARHKLRDERWVESDTPLEEACGHGLAFARQVFVEARACAAASVREWSTLLAGAVRSRVPDGMPWRVHVAPCYGEGTAGSHRCELILEAMRSALKRSERRRLKALVDAATPFSSADSLVQLALTAPDRGLISAAAAPVPFECRRVMSPFPLGEVPVASDKAAPSRAFAKLVEAELRLGRRIEPGEMCVDLGASPGSWSYVALRRGARVTAVDRSPLRDDLMREPRLEFQRGDAFKFEPAAPVDWLLCDVIAAPERSIGVLLDWLRERRMRRFVVTIKFKGSSDYAKLNELKQELPALCDEWFLTRLCANKNEVCVAGELGSHGMT
ncbi:MAG: hypothetical protein FJ386_14975 [Verrucomicrobia bacterium]|nr:hypothetical protein [Verrucomicrobiota bacterium]